MNAPHITLKKTNQYLVVCQLFFYLHNSYGKFVKKPEETLCHKRPCSNCRITTKCIFFWGGNCILIFHTCILLIFSYYSMIIIIPLLFNYSYPLLIIPLLIEFTYYRNVVNRIATISNTFHSSELNKNLLICHTRNAIQTIKLTCFYWLHTRCSDTSTASRHFGEMRGFMVNQ